MTAGRGLGGRRRLPTQPLRSHAALRRGRCTRVSRVGGKRELCSVGGTPPTNHRLGVEQGFRCGPPTLQGYLSYIKGLPLNDMPEIFGLHDNANITFAQNETYALLGAIIQLQPRSSSMGGQGREEVGGSRGQRAMGWAGSVSHPLSCLLLCGKEPSAYGIRQELSKGCWP